MKLLKNRHCNPVTGILYKKFSNRVTKIWNNKNRWGNCRQVETITSHYVHTMSAKPYRLTIDINCQNGVKTEIY